MTKNLKRYYEDQIDDLSRDTEDRYREFLLEQPETHVVENLIFDVRHLDTYYVCEGCKQKKPKAFCCKGHDLELTDRDLEVLDKLLPEFGADYPKIADKVEDGGLYEYGEGFEKHMRRKGNDECVFCLPAGEGCSLHAWALDRGVSPLKVKPYVCSLYPLVVIVIGDDIVVTTVNEESETILDVGTHATPCCSKKGKMENHTLNRSREILTEMFGARVYQKLRKRILGE